MIFNILSVFRELIKPSLKYGVLSKAIKKNKIKVNIFSYSDYLNDGDRLDDKQFGGEPGMVIKYQNASRAINAIKKSNPKTKVIFLTPKGKKLDNNLAKEMSKMGNISIICGRYEGFDERIIDQYSDLEVSIGDYIVSGGEYPAVILMDSISRMVKGVIGNEESVENDSLSNSLLKHPVYTRPAELKVGKVPKLITGGNHKKIKNFNRQESILSTLKRREDLLETTDLKIDERELLRKVKRGDIKSNAYLALVHYPIQNIKGEVIKTSLTNLDIQDIARTCMSYGIKKYYITHPVKEQRELAKNVLDYWEKGINMKNDSTKHKALENIEIKNSISDAIKAIKKIHGKKPKIVATDGRIMHNMVNYSDIRRNLNTDDSPYLFLFGTGWGLTKEVLDNADYILKPVGSYYEYNHLSVRSAVAIILDRIFGCNF
ncbi:tRNA (guanosine(37)-N1)-methyltransferase TrmD [bacterium]|nr:tRNA (guanosine(37)-N1)-methyltransferase TrmD [bacterium]